MRRSITASKILVCSIIIAVCGTIMVAMLQEAAHRGGLAELMGAAIAACIGYFGCWGVLSLESKADANTRGPDAETGPWGGRPIMQAQPVRRDVNSRMGWTALVFFGAVAAGVGWLVLSLWGGAEMLLLGWSVIGVFAAITIAFIWAWGPKA